MSDLAEDPRIVQLNEQIQNEKDSEQLVRLTGELIRLIDEDAGRAKGAMAN